MGAGNTLTVDVHHEADGQPHPSEELAVVGLLPGEHRTIDLLVPAMSSLVVHVTLDGVPAMGCRLVGVPGTRLDIIDNDLWGSFDLPKTVVRQDGMAILEGMPGGKLMLTATLPETRFVAYQVISALRPIGGVVHFPIVTQARTVVVQGRDGDPISGLEVELRQLSFQDGIRTPRMIAETPAGARTVDERTRIALALTDDAGKAHFTRVPVGGILVASVRDKGRSPLTGPVVLSATDNYAVLEEGSGSCILLHFVRDDGSPGGRFGFVVRNAESGFQHIATTDEKGDLLMQGLAPGRYNVLTEVGTRKIDLELEAGEVHEETIVLE
jgi:hypothetical protein